MKTALLIWVSLCIFKKRTKLSIQLHMHCQEQMLQLSTDFTLIFTLSTDRAETEKSAT